MSMKTRKPRSTHWALRRLGIAPRTAKQLEAYPDIRNAVSTLWGWIRKAKTRKDQLRMIDRKPAPVPRWLRKALERRS
jgi:hypothetical protein